MNANFMLLGATKLTKSQMKNVKGGISAEEYCCRVIHVIQNNLENFDQGAMDGANYAMNKCFGSNGYFPGEGQLNCSGYN